MADRYVCPVDGRSYRDVADFLNHATATHDHESDRDGCPCDVCRAGEESDE